MLTKALINAHQLLDVLPAPRGCALIRDPLLNIGHTRVRAFFHATMHPVSDILSIIIFYLLVQRGTCVITQLVGLGPRMGRLDDEAVAMLGGEQVLDALNLVIILLLVLLASSYQGTRLLSRACCLETLVKQGGTFNIVEATWFPSQLFR